MPAARPTYHGFNTVPRAKMTGVIGIGAIIVAPPKTLMKKAPTYP
jgi:hypothetical protein